MQPERIRDGIAGRGVWEAPYLVGGHEALIAVDSKGVARKHAKLLPGSSYERVKAALEQLLDRIDPLPQPPKLVIVRDVHTAARPPKLHPAHVDDYHAYRRRLIRQLSQNIRTFRD